MLFHGKHQQLTYPILRGRVFQWIPPSSLTSGPETLKHHPSSPSHICSSSPRARFQSCRKAQRAAPYAKTFRCSCQSLLGIGSISVAAWHRKELRLAGWYLRTSCHVFVAPLPLLAPSLILTNSLSPEGSLTKCLRYKCDIMCISGFCMITFPLHQLFS